MYDLEFTPKSDEEIESLEREERESRLLAEGPARFEVISAASKTSQAGNPMIHVKFKAWDSNNKSGFVSDFFMHSDSSFAIKKTKSFCYAAGIPEVYEKGKISANDIRPGLTGPMILGRQMYKGEEQNTIKEYLKAETSEKSETSEKIDKSKNDLNDDIPW